MSAIPYTQDDLETMGKTLWGESRGEPVEGREAVAWVIRNRAEHAFAGTLAGKEGAVAYVCKAPYQFSCWLKEDPNEPKLEKLQPADYAEEHDLAQDVLDGIVSDPTNGALNYYSPAGEPDGPPYWAAKMTYVGQFGSQLFYK